MRLMCVFANGVACRMRVYPRVLFAPYYLRDKREKNKMEWNERHKGRTYLSGAVGSLMNQGSMSCPNTQWPAGYPTAKCPDGSERHDLGHGASGYGVNITTRRHRGIHEPHNIGGIDFDLVGLTLYNNAVCRRPLRSLRCGSCCSHTSHMSLHGICRTRRLGYLSPAYIAPAVCIT